MTFEILVAGDSIADPAGYIASAPSKGFSKRFEAACARPVLNVAQAGSGVPDQVVGVYANPVPLGGAGVLCVGTNDDAANGPDAGKQLAYREGLRSLILHMATDRRESSDPALTYTGTWGEGNPLGWKASATPGDRVVIPCTGGTLYVDLIRRGFGAGDTVRFWQDEAIIGTYTTSQVAQSSNRAALGLLDYGPRCIALRGLSATPVTMELLSGKLYFNWFSQPSADRHVFVFNLPKPLAFTGIRTQATLDACNAIVDSEVVQLALDGNSVYKVDANAALIPSEMADNDHPDDVGHISLYNALAAKYNTAVGASLPILTKPPAYSAPVTIKIRMSDSRLMVDDGATVRETDTTVSL